MLTLERAGGQEQRKRALSYRAGLPERDVGCVAGLEGAGFGEKLRDISCAGDTIPPTVAPGNSLTVRPYALACR